MVFFALNLPFQLNGITAPEPLFYLRNRETFIACPANNRAAVEPETALRRVALHTGVKKRKDPAVYLYNKETYGMPQRMIGIELRHTIPQLGNINGDDRPLPNRVRIQRLSRTGLNAKEKNHDERSRTRFHRVCGSAREFIC